jgi:hypothetical protein
VGPATDIAFIGAAVSPRVLLAFLIAIMVVVLLIWDITSRHGGTMDGIWWVFLPVPVFFIAINLKELLVTWRSRRPQPPPLHWRHRPINLPSASSPAPTDDS